MSAVDVDALLSAVKRLGVTAPVFLDGERVSITEQDVMRLAGREAAVAELIEADKALDAANQALNTTEPQSEDAETMESMRAHRQRCIKRRAAALARVGGEA